MTTSNNTTYLGIEGKQIIKKDVVQKKLMNEILGVTTMIQKEFPELYVHLNETPLFLSNSIEGISLVDFEQYLESLKAQLATFKNTHLRKYLTV